MWKKAPVDSQGEATRVSQIPLAPLAIGQAKYEVVVVEVEVAALRVGIDGFALSLSPLSQMTDSSWYCCRLLPSSFTVQLQWQMMTPLHQNAGHTTREVWYLRRRAGLGWAGGAEALAPKRLETSNLSK